MRINGLVRRQHPHHQQRQPHAMRELYTCVSILALSLTSTAVKKPKERSMMSRSLSMVLGMPATEMLSPWRFTEEETHRPTHTHQQNKRPET